MRFEAPINDSWTFAAGFEPSWVAAPLLGEAVELPHTAVELPLSYFDETSYQRPFTYQRVIPWEDRFEGREVHLHFEGAMADATVWLDGEEVARHRDGFTPFEARLTGHLTRGDNLVTVRIDGSENPEIPPFGGQIDYLTYAGIYRDVWLKLADAVSIANLKVETSGELTDAKGVRVTGFVANPTNAAFSGTALVELCNVDGTVLHQQSTDVSGNTFSVAFDNVVNFIKGTPTNIVNPGALQVRR